MLAVLLDYVKYVSKPNVLNTSLMDVIYIYHLPICNQCINIENYVKLCQCCKREKCIKCRYSRTSECPKCNERSQIIN